MGTRAMRGWLSFIVYACPSTSDASFVIEKICMFGSPSMEGFGTSLFSSPM